MEFFIPSVIILLLAAAVVFFVLPRFGPLVLAVVSAVLLGLGVYQHYKTFGVEYRMSTWQLGLVDYAPYAMIGGLFLAIAVYLVYLLPTSANTGAAAATIALPTIANMPPANTSTNVLTSTINNTINSVANVVNNNNIYNKKNNNNNNNFFSNIFNNNGKNENKQKGLNFPFSQV